MRDARFAELDLDIAKEDRKLGLPERVMRNEILRNGNLHRKRKKKYHFIFKEEPERHVCDRRFRCGFDPQGVSLKKYRVHISSCEHQDCIDRHHRWLDLMKYFETFKHSRALGAAR